MTFYYDKVYLNETSTVCGPYEKKGPLRKYFDKTYDDLYFGAKSFEKAEVKSVRDSLLLIQRKSGIIKDDIDLVIGGDLLNQITSSSYDMELNININTNAYDLKYFKLDNYKFYYFIGFF